MRKRPALYQLNILLMIIYAISIPLLIISVMSFLKIQAKWISDNSNNITKYEATVTRCHKDGPRRMYYEISLELSNGDHIVLQDEIELSEREY